MISISGASIIGTSGNLIQPGQPFKVFVTIQNSKPIQEDYVTRLIYVTGGGDPFRSGTKTEAKIITSPPVWTGGRLDFEMDAAIQGKLGTKVDVYVIMYLRCPAKREANCPYVLFPVGSVTLVSGETRPTTRAVGYTPPTPSFYPSGTSVIGVEPYGYGPTTEKKVREPYMPVNPAEPLAFSDVFSAMRGSPLASFLQSVGLGPTWGITESTAQLETERKIKEYEEQYGVWQGGIQIKAGTKTTPPKITTTHIPPKITYTPSKTATKTPGAAPSVVTYTSEDIARIRAEQAEDIAAKKAAELGAARRKAEEEAQQRVAVARALQYAAAQQCGISVPNPSGDQNGFEAQMSALKSDVCMARSLIGVPGSQWKYVKPAGYQTVQATTVSEEERRKKLYIAPAPIKTSTVKIMSIGDTTEFEQLIDIWRKRR